MPYLELVETVGGDFCLYKRKGSPQHPCLDGTGKILQEVGIPVVQGKYNIRKQICSTKLPCL